MSHEANLVLEIQDLMDGVEWGSSILDQIASILTEGGYPVRDIDEKEEQLKPYQEGEWFFLLVPGYDHDEEQDVERETPTGSLVCITKSFQGEDNYSVECPETEGYFFMDAEDIRTKLMPVPTVYDALPVENVNGTMDRYTVIPAGEIDIFKERYNFLGCSIGGRAFSQWGEVKQLDVQGDFSHLGRKVPVQDLDEETQQHIFRRLSE